MVLINSQLTGGVLRLAKVVTVHPESGTIDVLFLDDGGRATGVQVCSPFAGTRAGEFTSYDVTPPGGQESRRWEPELSGDLDALAVIAMVGELPICLGMLPTQVNQMHFEQKDMKLDRHPKDTYVLMDHDGDYEVYHASNSWIKMGNDTQHKNLEGKDFDRKWKITKNGVGNIVLVANAGATGMKTQVILSSSGDIYIEASASVKINAVTDVDIDAGDNVRIKAGNNVTVDAGGNVTIKGSQIDLN